MSKISLRDDQWGKIVQFLRDHPRVYVGQEEQCRRFVEAALWMLRSGAQWRRPEENGKWNSVYKRFARWCEHGVFDDLFDYFSDDADMESVMPDSTVVRVHPCAARAAQKWWTNPPSAWSKPGRVPQQDSHPGRWLGLSAEPGAYRRSSA